MNTLWTSKLNNEINAFADKKVVKGNRSYLVHFTFFLSMSYVCMHTGKLAQQAWQIDGAAEIP